ncbi:plastocyanin/azurin family copper-binding protein [Verrucomicrobiales bacterium BCK34]|nr:plastocyanin/azurin family copper-binding protein [Verrucomicrobiales bacterium BCK34]
MRKILLTIAAVSTFICTSEIQAEDAAEVKITADKIQFAYDIKEFTVKPGQTVKITLVNPGDSVTRQPHNLLIVKPGKKDVVGMAANGAMSDPEFMTTKQAIPESEDILFHTKLVQAGEEDVLEFTAPEEEGDYPYICTYPGHWAIMNGVMKVAK